MGRNGSGVTARETSIQIAFTPPGGKPRRLTLKANGKAVPPTPANLKRAERLVIEIREKIKHGIFSMAEFFPDEEELDASGVNEYLQGWLKTLRAPASTKAKYTSACNFWATMPPTSLQGLKPSHIRTALANRPALSGKTVNDYVSVLRRALQDAVNDRLIADNPASKIEAAKAQKRPPDPFTREEAEAIIAKARERFAADGDMMEFRFFTGLRTGELIGLRWSTVELKAKRITVVGGRVRGEERDITKTGKTRVVDLNSRALAALTAQRGRSQATRGHVFLNPRSGKPYDNETEFSRQAWEPCLEALHMRYRRPYNTRHTYATMMLMAGMTPAYCAAQLGHSIEMFLTTYAKWLNGDRNALEQSKLEQFMSSAIPGAIDGDCMGLGGNSP
jgi:integrase